MTEPTMFTAQQAADPGTTPQMLADIAALRADLRPIVAGNPASYPGLLEWLGSLGEPAVDAALAARQHPAPPAPPAPAGWAPAAAPTVPYQPAQPWQGQPAQPWQGQPGQPWQGQQGQPGRPNAYQPAGTPPSTSGKRTLIIVGVVLGVLLLVGIGVFFAVKSLISDAVDSFSSAGPTAFSSGERYGDDPALDSLWEDCSTGDRVSCDDLYDQSPIGSEYETFGDTCGGIRETGTGLSCVVP